jgi:hypothetical protein
MKLTVETIDDLKDSCIQLLKSVNNDMITLQQDRIDSLNAYLSKEYGNEVEGRSKFVTSDLSDVVESVMPALMKTFYGNKSVASLLPVGIEDEKPAKLMEELVNWQFQTQMPGYQILDTWFRDSLYQKIGVVKYYWLEDVTYKPKEYTNLTEAEYLNLLQQVDAGTFIIDKEETVVEEEAEFDELGEVIRPTSVMYEVEGRKVTKVSRPNVENIPPEEFIFDIHAKNVEDCSIVAHKKRVHKTYLKKYDITTEDIDTEYDSFANSAEYINRFADIGGVRFFRDPENPDFVYIYECYVNYYDKKGKKQPMKVTIMGNTVIDCEENKYGKPPFCVLTPITVPHRMVGRDLADLVRPIQELHTYYIRYINDNLAYQNNGMRVVNPFRVQMDDVLNENQPGGIWRTKYDIDPSRCVVPLTPTPLAPEVYGLIDKMEIMRQERTGVTKYNNGMDSKSLNRTATGISQIMNAAMQRTELLARTYAETGIKDLFQALVDMNLDFFDTTTAIRINKDWATITPQDVDGKFDILVDVTASMGTSEVKVQQMLQALNTYAMSAQMGAPVPAKYVYNVLREIWSLWGYKNVDLYAPPPEQIVQDMQEQQQGQMAVAQSAQQTMQQAGMMPPQGMPQQGPATSGPPPMQMGMPQ